MSIRDSILFPKGPRVSDRRYHEAGVRGRFESNLRIVRGRIDTTTPTILQGVGFSVVSNGTGDVTVTFDPPFSDILTFTTMVDNAVGSTGRFMVGIGAPTASTLRIQRNDAADLAVDGTFSFIATGPA